MLFSVIYEFDCAMDIPVKRHMPANRRLFQITEQSDGEPSDWCGELFDGKCKHRKLCALLTRKQFDKFVESTYLRPESCETGGSLGAPGLGFGLSPAIAFNGRDDEYGGIQCAYVTPLPMVYNLEDLERFPRRPRHPVRKLRQVRRQFSEEDFQRIKKAILSVYD